MMYFICAVIISFIPLMFIIIFNLTLMSNIYVIVISWQKFFVLCIIKVLLLIVDCYRFRPYKTIRNMCKGVAITSLLAITFSFLYIKLNTYFIYNDGLFTEYYVYNYFFRFELLLVGIMILRVIFNIFIRNRKGFREFVEVISSELRAVGITIVFIFYGLISSLESASLVRRRVAYISSNHIKKAIVQFRGIIVVFFIIISVYILINLMRSFYRVRYRKQDICCVSLPLKDEGKYLPFRFSLGYRKKGETIGNKRYIHVNLEEYNTEYFSKRKFFLVIYLYKLYLGQSNIVEAQFEKILNGAEQASKSLNNKHIVVVERNEMRQELLVELEKKGLEIYMLKHSTYFITHREYRGIIAQSIQDIECRIKIRKLFNNCIKRLETTEGKCVLYKWIKRYYLDKIEFNKEYEVFYFLVKINELYIYIISSIVLAIAQWEKVINSNDIETYFFQPSIGSIKSIAYKLVNQISYKHIHYMWHSAIDDTVKEASRALKDNLELNKSSRIRKYHQLHDLIIEIRNKKCGHGVIPYEISYTTIEELFKINDFYMEIILSLDMSISNNDVFMCIEEKEFNLKKYIRYEGDEVWVLNSITKEYQEFINYRTGDFKYLGQQMMLKL